MDKYEYSKEWDKCTYNLYLDSCRGCLFNVLCKLEKDKQRYLSLNEWNNGERKKVQ